MYNLESFDFLDFGFEFLEFEDVEVLNSVVLEIVFWWFELWGCLWDERLYFEWEDEERVDCDDCWRNIDWWVVFGVC